MPWLMLLVGSVVAVLLGVWVRHARLHRLQAQIQQARSQALPALGVGALGAAEVLWQWASIDPQVIRAVDAAHVDSVTSGFDLAQWVHQRIDPLEGDSLAGMQNRLLGYLGEQRVSGLLAAQGHQVEMATTANQPIWDLLMDGQQVNVKTVLELDGIREVALSHPEVLYVVPEDAVGRLTDNMQRLEGFRHAEVHEAWDSTLDQVDAVGAFDLLGVHLPFMRLFRSVCQNHQAMQQGRDLDVAIRHVAYDTLVQGGLTVASATFGGKLGTALAGPLGTLAGTVLGGVAGSVVGGEWAMALKRRPLELALAELDRLLCELGAQHAAQMPRVLHYLQAPLQRQQETLAQLQQCAHSVWTLWPSASQVWARQACRVGRQQVQQQQAQVMPLLALLQDSQTRQDHRPLALLLLNVPVLRELLGADANRIRAIQQAQQAVLRERLQLNPELQGWFGHTAQGRLCLQPRAAAASRPAA